MVREVISFPIFEVSRMQPAYRMSADFFMSVGITMTGITG